MIKHKSFKHGWFYHYRVHEPKLAALCSEHPALLSYLQEVFDDCPDEKFTSGPRSSALRFNLPLAIKEAHGHEVCSLASAAPPQYRTAHSNVQMHMLSGDGKTIGVEVPIWMDDTEHQFMEHFECGPLSGHIDCLRVEDGKIWVWDYKPKAIKEKYASTQTFAYAVMLSVRTGIPLTEFRCGWFDEEAAFVFLPELAPPEDVVKR